MLWSYGYRMPVRQTLLCDGIGQDFALAFVMSSCEVKKPVQECHDCCCTLGQIFDLCSSWIQSSASDF